LSFPETARLMHEGLQATDSVRPPLGLRTLLDFSGGCWRTRKHRTRPQGLQQPRYKRSIQARRRPSGQHDLFCGVRGPNYGGVNVLGSEAIASPASPDIDPGSNQRQAASYRCRRGAHEQLSHRPRSSSKQQPLRYGGIQRGPRPWKKRVGPKSSRFPFSTFLGPKTAISRPGPCPINGEIQGA